ncbi:MAG TPA: hypothetical protein VI757_08000 [Bacteroidia bacterium]|nr:hypothetical protein [Bacteroidia bacterium]
MNLEKKYSVAAFIDILGYKELILKESIERETELFADLKETIDFALQCTSESIKSSMDFLDNKFESSERLAKKLNVKQFSDNIYFSFDYSTNDKIDLYFGIYIITTISCLYQRLMLGKGYFVRGGIANGLNMVDKNFIFSTALIKAVETEKETIYPRITLHKELRDIYVEAKDNPFRELTSGQLVEDWAEQVFLNPFLNYEQRTQKELDLLPQEIVQGLFQNISKKQRRLINKINNKFADYFDDKKFHSLARKKIAERIKKHKNK